jgi:hypothetical protein
LTGHHYRRLRILFPYYAGGWLHNVQGKYHVFSET